MFYRYYGYRAGGQFFYYSTLYEPGGERWTETTALLPNGGNEAAIVLADGRVFLSGGNGNLACITPGCSSPLAATQAFDPATNRWTALAPMPMPRLNHCAVRLPDQTVLVMGGYAPRARAGDPVTSTVRYEPSVDHWSERSPSRSPHVYCTATLLDGGRVLLIGADSVGKVNAEFYDIGADRWSPAPVPDAVSRASGATYLNTILLPLQHHLVAAQ